MASLPSRYVLATRIRARVNELSCERDNLLRQLRDIEMRVHGMTEAIAALRDAEDRAEEIPGCPICHEEATKCTSDHK